MLLLPCGRQISSVGVLQMKRTSKSGLVRSALISPSFSLMELHIVRVEERYVLSASEFIPSSMFLSFNFFNPCLYVSTLTKHKVFSDNSRVWTSDSGC